MAQKEYLKMACSGGFEVSVMPERFNYALNAKKAELAAHAINSHDELVADVERLRAEIELYKTYSLGA